MEKDPLRWHGGIKVSMAAALNDGLNGLVLLLPQVSGIKLLQRLQHRALSIFTAPKKKYLSANLNTV